METIDLLVYKQAFGTRMKTFGYILSFYFTLLFVPFIISMTIFIERTQIMDNIGGSKPKIFWLILDKHIGSKGDWFSSAKIEGCLKARVTN